MNTKKPDLYMRHNKDGSVRPESMAAHTPGPWQFFDNAGKNMQGYCQPSGVCGTGENRGQLVCGCFGDVRGGEQQAKANARLIAAAPELLEAIKDAVAAYDDGDLDGAVISRLRAAIAKATNETL